MYYKVLKNDKVIDVLNGVTYLRWQPKNKIMVLCNENEAQSILSSDGNTIWHERTLRRIPADAGEYDNVSIIEIDEYEYRQLNALNMKTPEEIIDEYNLLLLEMGVI